MQSGIPYLAEGTGYKFADSLTSGSSRSESEQNPSIVIMSDPELQSLLNDDTDQATQQPQRKNDTATIDKVNEVFTMFKTYLEEKIDEKGRQLELKDKAEKEVVQLNFKGNQKQYKLNTKVDVMLDAIETANLADNGNPRITTLVNDAKGLLKRSLQKLIKFADRNKDGWKVVEEYELDEIASDSEDEKRLKRAKEAASRKRRQNLLQLPDCNKRHRFNSEADQTLFVLSVSCSDCARILMILCIFYLSGSTANPPITCVSLIYLRNLS